jgi:hypothetical protein
MLEDSYPINLSSEELFTFISILDEWMAENPNPSGPRVQFIDALYDKVHSLPYPAEAADRFHSLLADFEAEQKTQKEQVSLYRCPRCNSPVELGPEKEGGFCFTCLIGLSKQTLKKLVSR